MIKRPDAIARAAIIAGVLAAVSLKAAAVESFGVLLMAHGGAPEWNREVMKVAQAERKTYPVEVAFGMADGEELQRAVGKLEAKGVKKIVAVPLFVSSHSEVLDHTRFLLGLRDKPSEVFVSAMKHMPHQAAMAAGMSMDVSTTPIHRSVPIVMTSALDDDELLIEILAGHATALSKTPAKDTLIIVGHGPYDDPSNQAWLATLGGIAERIGLQEGFKAAYAATLRDDNPPRARAAAVKTLRDMVKAAAQDGGRAVVVPDLIAREGIESHVVEALAGLSYAWDGKTILPHPNVARWVAQQAKAAAAQ
jgi:sirohydrochlorin ferrochelatase